MKTKIKQPCDTCRESCHQPEGAIVMRCGHYAPTIVEGHAVQNAQDRLGSDESLSQVSLDGFEHNGDLSKAKGETL